MVTTAKAVLCKPKRKENPEDKGKYGRINKARTGNPETAKKKKVEEDDEKK